ncbi:DUF624 domain-containing protein [Brachybacterium sp. DNPG3]
MNRAFQLLGTAGDLLVRALAVQGIWLLGTLAGGVVLGWAPATMAAVDAAARGERGESITLARAARVWRDSFRRSQLTLGLPGLALVLGLLTATTTGAPLIARVPAAIGAVGLAVALLHVPMLDRRYELPASRVLSRALLVSLAQLPTSLLLGAVLVLWAGILSSIPGLVPFLGIAVPVLMAQHLVSRSLERNDALVAAQAQASAEPSRPVLARQGP